LIGARDSSALGENGREVRCNKWRRQKKKLTVPVHERGARDRSPAAEKGRIEVERRHALLDEEKLIGREGVKLREFLKEREEKRPAKVRADRKGSPRRQTAIQNLQPGVSRRPTHLNNNKWEVGVAKDVCGYRDCGASRRSQKKVCRATECAADALK